MQKLTGVRAATATQAVLLFGCVLLQGCGWNRTMVFPSPSGKASVEIWQTGIDNSRGTRVDLLSSSGHAVIYENRREALVYFVHVYWAPDERSAAVLATGANIWSVAFDVPSGRLRPFESVRDGFARSLKRTYTIPATDDPISWATSAKAQDAFFKLHPEIRLTYR
jgi:hypothetical protein